MTCPNFKVKMIKMHDTRFWCCDDYKRDFDEYEVLMDWKFCPWCGSKIR